MMDFLGNWEEDSAAQLGTCLKAAYLPSISIRSEDGELGSPWQTVWKSSSLYQLWHLVTSGGMEPNGLKESGEKPQDWYFHKELSDARCSGG